MNTHTDGERVVTLDKERVLRLDFNALALAEEKTGRNLMSAEGWKGLTARDYRTLIWSCLVHEDPDLTIEQVGASMRAGKSADAVTKALWELYLGDVVVDELTRPTASDGANGGPSPESTSVLATPSSGD